MDATLITGDGTNPRTITNQVGFKPDLIWQKARSATWAHVLFDSVRGFANDKGLYSNLTDVEGANRNGYVSAATTTGYSVATGTSGNQYSNENGTTYDGWQWQAGQGTTSTNTNGILTSTVSVNATAGFSIITYTAPSSSQANSVGHGLSAAPAFVLAKNRSSGTGGLGWAVYHESLGSNKYLSLNGATAASTVANYWGSGVTSTVVGLPTCASSTGYDNCTGNMVAYCWTPIPGYSAFGSYTGNASTDGPFVYLGFRPKCIIWKNSATTNYWRIMDTSVNTSNVTSYGLYPNDGAVEDTATNWYVDYLSNGFKIRASQGELNGSGNTIIYAAFAENPFKYANAR